MTDSLTPGALDACYVPPSRDARPTLFVIVDTEEEFDWGAPLSREQTNVRAMRNIDRLQNIVRAEPAPELFQIPSDYTLNAAPAFGKATFVTRPPSPPAVP